MSCIENTVKLLREDYQVNNTVRPVLTDLYIGNHALVFRDLYMEDNPLVLEDFSYWRPLFCLRRPLLLETTLLS